MILVVDTNILFSYFKKESVAHLMIQSSVARFVSPEFALIELKKHAPEIRRKAFLSPKAFNTMRLELTSFVEFLPLETYAKELKKAVAVSPDPDDCDFFAVALSLKAPLWSNDRALKQQQHLPVFSTQDLLNHSAFEGLFGH